MKKMLAVTAILMFVSLPAYAYAKKPSLVTMKEKVYGTCTVAAPQKCGGSLNVNWNDPVAKQAFFDCTKVEQDKCWAEFVK
jgi:hypothetical protein